MVGNSPWSSKARPHRALSPNARGQLDLHPTATSQVHGISGVLATEGLGHRVDLVKNLVVGEMLDESHRHVFGECPVASAEQHRSQEIGSTEAMDRHGHFDVIQERRQV